MDEIEIRKSLIPNSGDGVFALRSFKAGELISSSNVALRGPYQTLSDQDKCVVFKWDKRLDPPSCAIADGFGSFFNHSNPSNATYDREVDQNRMHFIAAKDIDAGEEITINYGAADGGMWCKNDWFFNDKGHFGLGVNPDAKRGAFSSGSW
jgi:hypothetical protein